MEEMEFVEQNTGAHEAPKQKTGAKSVRKTIVIVGLALTLGIGGVIFGATKGAEIYNDVQVSKRTEAVITLGMVNNKLCDIPEKIYTTQGYDIEYCSGEKFVSILLENGVEIVKLNDEYYTNDAIDIAIIRYAVDTTITKEADKVEVNGSVIYMAPTGYTLNPDGTCSKVETDQKKEIITASATGDYSQYGEDVEVEVIKTKSFDELRDGSIICDVEDNAKANEEGYYPATLKLSR